MNTLQLLIKSRMAERNWSYADIARRAELPRSTVHDLATNDRAGHRPPHPRTLERLAAGLDLPLEQLRAAAADAAGLSVWHESADDPEIDVLVAALTQLTADQRRYVAALVRSMLSDSNGSDGSTGSAGTSDSADPAAG